MKCECGGSLERVKDSRPAEVPVFGLVIRRRRECTSCNARTSTVEIIEGDIDKVKKDLAKQMTLKLIGEFL